MKKNILILFFITFSLALFSQEYEMIDTATLKKRQELKQTFEEKYKLHNKMLKEQYNGKLYKTILKRNENFQESFLEKIEDSYFVFDKELQDFTEKILDTIIIRNPSLKKTDITLLLSKDIGPNAGVFIDGTMVVNLGLFWFLDNEDQLAAVLCHELGHEQLDHSVISLEEHAKQELSDELKQKSKSLKKNRYGTYNEAFETLKDILYADSELSRKRELEADSLGYELFKNTPYNINEFVASLRVLKELDDYQEEIKNKQILDTADYKKWFDLPELPFKNAWLKQEDFSDYNYDLYKEKMDEDSISSHPEIEKRIQILLDKNKEINPDYTIKEPSAAYKRIQKIAAYERIPNLYHHEAYGLSIYYILQMLKTEKYDQAFLKEWLGYNFDQLYTAKKEYKYNRYVDQINPKEQSKTYIQFLNFMWNLGLNDIQTIANHYKKEIQN